MKFKYLFLILLCVNAFAKDFVLPTAKEAHQQSEEKNAEWLKKCTLNWKAQLEFEIMKATKEGGYHSGFLKLGCISNKDFQNELDRLKKLGYTIRVDKDYFEFGVSW